MERFPLGAVLAFAILGFPGARAAASSGETACMAGINAAERTSTVPPTLLSAIARAESGRALPGGGVAPWPWTLNVAGIGHFYATAPEAIAAVEGLQAAGVRSIDVGCMQINLMHHASAFTSLQEAFDPVANATYAARFLVRLHAEFAEWPRAIEAYHSRDPAFGPDYGRRVIQGWMSASRSADREPRPAEANRTAQFALRLARDEADRAALDRQFGVGPSSTTRRTGMAAGSRLPPTIRVAGLAQLAGRP